MFTLQPLLDGVDRARYGAILRELAPMVDDGVVRPIVDETAHTLDTVEQAHDRVRIKANNGKVVIVVDGGRSA